jgi:hypothetical protein
MPFMVLDYKIPEDNENKAVATKAVRAESFEVAERIVRLPDPQPDRDPLATEWIAGRIGDGQYVNSRELHKPFLERRIFAVMWARSCALRGQIPGQHLLPLDSHYHEFDKFSQGFTNFREMLHVLKGWSLGEIPFDFKRDVEDYDRF